MEEKDGTTEENEKISNVIQFPRTSDRPRNIEEIRESIENIRLLHINEALSEIYPYIMNRINVAGFWPDEEEVDEDILVDFTKQCSFLGEALRSLLCMKYSIEHPFQVIGRQVIVENEEDGSYELSENIENIDFNVKPTNIETTETEEKAIEIK